MILRNNFARLAILALVHFTVDFFAGILIPLLEPTLTQHFGVDLARVALLVGGTAIIVNVIQPVSGWILPRKGAPILLLLGPPTAALVACIGLTDSLLIMAVMLITASIGIGIVHPEGALAAHSLAGERKGLGVSTFMAAGYFGFALGSLVSGVWVESHDPGLARFWLLALPALIVVILVLLSGLHRLQGHVDEEMFSHLGVLPFKLVLGLAVCIAVNVCILVRFITIFLVRSFPGQDPQSWGGAAVCVMGVSGGLCAFVWGHLSDRFRSGWLIFAAQLLGAPFLYLLLRVRSASTAPVWALGVGLTMGAVFPLTIVLAREARGLPQRLRIGLVIGGAWCMGEVAFILGGKYVTLFPEDMARPVASVLNVCWVCLAATAILAAILARVERGMVAPIECGMYSTREGTYTGTLGENYSEPSAPADADKPRR